MFDVIKKVSLGIGKVLGFRFSTPLIVLLILLGLTSWGTIDFARRKPEVLGLIKGPSIIQQEEEDLIKRIGQLIELPQGEKPTVATVTEESKLKEQAFFSKAKNGDKVLVYTNARQVVVYRPLENRIISVGSVNISQQEEMQGDLATPSPTPVPTTAPTAQPSESN